VDVGVRPLNQNTNQVVTNTTNNNNLATTTAAATQINYPWPESSANFKLIAKPVDSALLPEQSIVDNNNGTKNNITTTKGAAGSNGMTN
jgi:hypothetical protein